jgi:hypothetical protein
MKKPKIVAVVLAVLLVASAYAQSTNLSKAITPQEAQAAIDKGAGLNASLGSVARLIWAATYNKDPETITTLRRAGADIEARETNRDMTARDVAQRSEMVAQGRDMDREKPKEEVHEKVHASC